MRVFGALASAGIRCRQRPPVPISPMLMRSLAPSGCADAGSVRAVVAAAVADEARNLRRETETGDIAILLTQVRRRCCHRSSASGRDVGSIMARHGAACQQLVGSVRAAAAGYIKGNLFPSRG